MIYCILFSKIIAILYSIPKHSTMYLFFKALKSLTFLSLHQIQLFLLHLSQKINLQLRYQINYDFYINIIVFNYFVY